MKTPFTKKQITLDEDGKSTAFIPPLRESKGDQDEKNAFESDYHTSLAFYQKALQCYHKQEFLIATFMMQQAVQFTCIALLKALTGLKVKAVETKDFIECLKNYIPQVKSVFPCNSEIECSLVQQLSKVDINKDKFEITGEEVMQLLIKTEKLQKLASEVFPKIVGEGNNQQ